jgi:hypothetical protein
MLYAYAYEDRDYGSDASTWGNLNKLWREPARYQSPEEFQRQERIAIGRICGCKLCMCCKEAESARQSAKVKTRQYTATNV